MRTVRSPAASERSVCFARTDTNPLSDSEAFATAACSSLLEPKISTEMRLPGMPLDYLGAFLKRRSEWDNAARSMSAPALREQPGAWHERVDSHAGRSLHSAA